MKATEKAYQKLDIILNGYGFRIEENDRGFKIIRSMEEGSTEYVSIQVAERMDGCDNAGSFEDFRAHGHLEVTAGICRMGGEMDAGEFAEAASQMGRCSGLMARLEKEDLSYTSLINGEAAEEA